eukprot:TRINITY_DN1418_c0_g1_i11.p1 TRINITY_DN1418_c0_g1~~TRINITY_DN1418_c0_g1_i11.p1  ORF type:complete len:102 (-),score=18.49 TRINITY_DN1418_c0_g1_i11:479-784(-)
MGDETGQSTLSQTFTAGGVSGLALSLVSTPVDRIKIMMQVQSSQQAQVQYKNTLSCTKYIVSQQGLKSLYYGYVSNFMVQVSGSALWFGVYHVIKTLNTGN